MLRAASKLAEARFFLTRLARTRGKLPRAMYYASATISALRSVTWVLQADLRGRHGTRFDHWWNDQIPALQGAGIGFALLKESRNHSEKVGTPLVRNRVQRTFAEGSIQVIEFLVDPGFETLANFRIQFRDFSADPKSGLLPKTDKLLVDMLELKTKVELLRDHWVQGTAELDPTFGTSTPILFDAAVMQLQQYLRALSGIVSAAESEFVT